MATTVRHVKIILSSPGNLKNDRQIIRQIVDTINQDSGQRNGFYAEVIGWETHTRPAAGEYAQAVINDQFPSDVDIFVGLMGSHFGSPTPRFNSGTEEEFDIAYKSWSKDGSPEIMFYFSTQSSSLSSIDPDQYKLVLDFKKNLENLGVYYFQYESELGLRLNLHPQLSRVIHEVLESKDGSDSPTTFSDESLDILSTLDDLLANDPLVAASDLASKASRALDAYTELQNKLTKMIAKLGKTLNSAVKKLNGTASEKYKIKAVNDLCSSLEEYQLGLREILPRKEHTFIKAMTSIQRSILIIKENDLADVMPYNETIGPTDFLIESLEPLVEIITNTNDALNAWPEDMGDLSIQKKLVCAIHIDMKQYYENAIELLKGFRSTLED